MVKIDRNKFSQTPQVMEVIAARLTWDGIGKFTWERKTPSGKINVKKKLMPILLQMTTHHCSFCDYKLNSDIVDIPIEHFYPKCAGKYPEKAYEWTNLFPCCPGCTKEKGDKFDFKLLKPDDEDYYFESFFYVTGDGKMAASLSAEPAIASRAEETIEIYKLNRGGLVTLRKQWIENFKKLHPINNPNVHPFRFLIPASQAIINPDDVINSFIQ